MPNTQKEKTIDGVLIHWHDDEGGLYVPGEEYDEFTNEIEKLLQEKGEEMIREIIKKSVMVDYGGYVDAIIKDEAISIIKRIMEIR